VPSERASTRTVLHVLPHPGGGGEAYVDLLSRMAGYRFERVYLAAEAAPRGRLRILWGGVDVLRAARRHDVVHVHGEVASAICLPALVRGRSVVTLHGLHLLRRTAGIGRRAALTNLQLLVRAATRTICVAQAEYDEVLDLVGVQAASRLRVVPNGVDPRPLPDPAERAAARAELGLAPATVAGVYVGALDPHKDPLVAARAALATARAGGAIALLVAGEGRLRGDLERLAAEAGNDVVRVLGRRDDIPRLLAAADFFVLPSLREGLSFAVLEAMAVGLPPVVSDALGNPEAVGDAGRVVARGDVDAFAAAFQALVEDAALRHALGVKARERVATHFGADRMVAATQQIYDEVALSV